MRHRGGLTAVAVAAFVAGSAALASGSAPSVPRVTGSRDLTVIAKHTKFSIGDTGENGTSIGDELVFTATDWNGDETRELGRLDGHCVFTELNEQGDDLWEQCFLTHSLPGGQITLQGTFNQATSHNQFAITGGTGNYRNVRGYVGLRFRKQFRFEIHLLP